MAILNGVSAFSRCAASAYSAFGCPVLQRPLETPASLQGRRGNLAVPPRCGGGGRLEDRRPHQRHHQHHLPQQRHSQHEPLHRPVGHRIQVKCLARLWLVPPALRAASCRFNHSSWSSPLHVIVQGFIVWQLTGQACTARFASGVLPNLLQLFA